LLKIQCIYDYNFGASGTNLMKLYQATCQVVAVIMCVQLLEESPQQNLQGKKRQKFGAISDNIRIWSQISLNEILKTALLTTPLPIGKKFVELWSTNKKL